MEPGKDDAGRFFVEDAYVIDQGADGKPVQRKVKVGLVGMHVGHKSETSPQWIWATFEQVDNLDVDQVAHPNLHASFNDASCPICTVNVQPQKGKNGAYPRVPVQLSRTIPIPPDKVHLNAEVAAVLGKAGSIWQYYELIDTQWPTDPTSPPAAWDSGLAQAVANKPGGQPTPGLPDQHDHGELFPKWQSAGLQPGGRGAVDSQLPGALCDAATGNGDRGLHARSRRLERDAQRRRPSEVRHFHADLCDRKLHGLPLLRRRLDQL